MTARKNLSCRASTGCSLRRSSPERTADQITCAGISPPNPGAVRLPPRRSRGRETGMPNSSIEPCPGCGLTVGPTDGPRHPYIGSSPGCWALFNELLVIGPGGDVPGQLAGDAYAVQHPGALERRAIQSACVHAINLCARLEWDYPEKRIKDLMRSALT